MAKQIKDDYQIIAEIGAGGMATVFKAVQKSLDRPVAIKELKKTYHGDDQIVKRFERESRVAASLQHENIVHIYDYWKKPNYAIVMEYVDGTTLADVIEKTGALPVDVGIMIAVQVSNALEYAHMRGLIHRDIKPSNIMIKRNGEVKLMDFGIAHTRSLEALTVPGMLIGTPAYMSPEQILGQQLDVRSDIFSFGIVLYEMFTGGKPFSDEDSRSVTAKILKDAFPPPRRANSDIPWRLQRLIKKCLKKKPQRRFESMLDVERRLGRHVAGKTTKAASLHRIADYLVSRNIFEAAPEQETVIMPVKSRRPGGLARAAVAAAVVLLLAAGAAAYHYRTTIVRLYFSPPAELPPIRVIEPPTRTRPLSAAPTSTSSPVGEGDVNAPKGTAAGPKADSPASDPKGTAAMAPAAKHEPGMSTQKKPETARKKKRRSRQRD